jgi:hypothetical protein
MNDFFNTAVYSFIGGPQNVKIRQISETSQCISSPLPYIPHPLTPEIHNCFGNTKYQYIIKMVLTNCVTCFSHCGLVSEFGVHVVILKHGLAHSST